MPTPAAVGSLQELTLDRPAVGGAVGRTQDGQVVFARHGLPGERVVITITESTRTYARGEVTTVLAPSKDRVAPPCPHAVAFGCGGCDLQEARPGAQRRWKSLVATERLAKALGPMPRVPVQSVGPMTGVRTRIRCAVDREGRLAQRKARSHELVPIEGCLISEPAFAPAFATRWPDANEVELRAIGRGRPFAVVRPREGRKMIETRTLTNEPLPGAFSEVEVGGFTYRVGPTSFWQVHEQAPDVLLAAVQKYADVSEGDHVADLFCGVGLFSVPLAHAVGGRGTVTAVESASVSCADARYNARAHLHVGIRHGRVGPRTIDVAVKRGDLVVMDPPREGAGKEVMGAIVGKWPRRVIYVSCDAATLARDLTVALQVGYTVSALEAYDLFPMTEHLELVAVLDEPPRRGQSGLKGPQQTGAPEEAV